MELVLLLLYGGLLILQIVLTVQALRGRCPGKWPLLLELTCAAAAAGAMVYFNSLPGYGFMPGLTWLGHVLFSFFAALAYAAMLAVTGLLLLIRRLRHRK